MKKFPIALAFLLSALGLQAQKELSLSDAVMKQWSTLGPERLYGLGWKANSDQFVYQKSDRSGLYFMAEVANGKSTPQRLFSIDDLNSALGTNMRRLPALHWDDADQFWFQSQGHVYEYNLATKQGKKLNSYGDGGNAEFNRATNRVAYTQGNNLYVKAANGKAIPITTEEEGIVSGQAIHRYEFGITKGMFWSPKGTFLAFYQKDERAVNDYPLVDVSTTPATLKNIKYPMAGQSNEVGRAGVYDFMQGKVVWLKTGSEDQFLSCLTWGPNEQYIYLALVNRDQNHVKVNQYDRATGDLVKTLFEEKDEKYVEPEKDLLFLPGSSKEFIWWSERDGYMQPYLYNTDGKLVRRLASGDLEVEHPIGFGAKGRMLYVQGTANLGMDRQIYAIDVKKGKQKQITRTAGSWDATLAGNGKYLLATHQSMTVPRRTVVLDLKGKEVKLVKESANPLADVQTGTTEIVAVKAKDGTTLNARLIKPANFDATKKYPVFVYVYGGPRAQMVTNTWMGGASLWMHYLANQGYLVWTLDNRGSENRGIEFEQAVFRELGTLEMQDQLDGVDYLKSLPYVDGDRMAVHGWSFGGFMTGTLMLRAPGTFKVGVAGGPVTDWSYYEIMYGEKYMDSPQTNPEGYENARLMNHVDGLEGDLLMIHGDMDDVVVLQHNVVFQKECIKKGKQVDFFVYPGHQHNVYGMDRVHLMEKVINYVTERL